MPSALDLARAPGILIILRGWEPTPALDEDIPDSTATPFDLTEHLEVRGG
ncbi:MAG: hypothetical protein AAGB07_15640 [Pseudomonadota bacterium]